MGRIPNDKKINVVNIRLVKEPYLYSDKRITSPEDAMETIAEELKDLDRECFAVLNLKTNGQPINFNVVSLGTLDSSMVHPREVFKSAILSNAGAIIAIHNHPSGNMTPSNEDREVTERLKNAGELLGIKMLDHVIIGGLSGALYSFRSMGEL